MIHISTEIPMIQHEMFYFTGQQRLFHYHARLLCLVQGTVSICLNQDNIKMECGDLLFLPAQTSYQLDSSSCTILYLCIHPYFLLTALGQKCQQIRPLYTAEQPELRDDLNHLVAAVAVSCLNQEADSCAIYARTYDLLHYLSAHCLLPVAGAKDDKTAQKLIQLAEFLDRHYMEAISLTDAAATLGYTPPYLSNFIKKNLQMTFQDYLNSFRITAAKILLCYSTETIAKIGILCGFPNLVSFQKSFKKNTRISVDEYYHKNHVTVAEEPVPLGVPVTNPYMIFDYLLPYTPQSVSPEITNTGVQLEQVTSSSQEGTPFAHIWNFLINMGSASDFEKPTFRHHLSHIQSELHFQYGRCSEILTLVESFPLENTQQYDFSRIFRLIDFMYSIHLKPFFDLDAKPFQFYHVSEDSCPDYKTYLSADSYDTFLYEVLPSFAKACILRYGFDEFSTWHFELWYRYNPDMTSLETPADFCHRFQQVAAILKSIVPDVHLGGPGFNSFLDDNTFSRILSLLQHAKYQPDFISTCYFPCLAPEIPSDGGYTVAPPPHSMTNRLRELKKLLSEHDFGSTPFYITEYSAHPCATNYINDSIYAAAYILYQGIQDSFLVDGLGYWLATDLSLNYGRPNAPFFGGNGLFSRHGIPKPSYYAHNFLNHLGPDLLTHGDHYIVTTAPDHSLQIIMLHYGILKQNFAHNPKTYDLLPHPYSAFEELQPLEFEITLTSLPHKRYMLKEWNLDLNFGNVLRIWGRLNHSNDVGPEETQYIHSRSHPSMEIHLIDCSGYYTLNRTLKHNEAKLITLHPQF